MSSIISGNTNTSISARHFQLTLNDVSKFDKVKSYLTKSKMLKYIIASKEVAPTTGHEHIHIYVQFNQKKRLAFKKLEGAHVELCKGTPQQNYDYIIKDGNVIFEEGELGKSGAKSIKDVKAMSKDEREELDIRYYNIVKQINQAEDLEINVEDLHKDVKVVYICGDSGSGKTQLAKKMLASHTDKAINVVKHVNDFWEGVGESKVALYDEFRDSHMKASEFINFIDYNKQLMNIKGGYKLNRYETIIITSIQHPKEIYRNMPEEAKEQWLRRIKIIDLSKNKREEILNDEF